jgi:hypothetical protein
MNTDGARPRNTLNTRKGWLGAVQASRSATLQPPMDIDETRFCLADGSARRGRRRVASGCSGLAAETRNPKAEDRKKAEPRSPKKLRTCLEARRFRKLWLAGKRLVGNSGIPLGRRVVLSRFGFRPSFGFRVSAFGFATLITPPGRKSPSP